MSKQEEIQEGIHKHIKDTLIVCGQNPITAEALALDTTQDVMEEIHSQGCVLKVEEEPEWETYYGDMPGKMYRDGWRRFVPLIEKTQKEVANG